MSEECIKTIIFAHFVDGSSKLHTREFGTTEHVKDHRAPIISRWFHRQRYDSAIENEDQVDVMTKTLRPNLLNLVRSELCHRERTLERKNAPNRLDSPLQIGHLALRQRLHGGDILEGLR